MKNTNVFLHQENAPCHKLIKAIAKIHKFHFKVFRTSVPSYVHDLVPSDLLADRKSMLAGNRFRSNDEVLAKTGIYFVIKLNRGVQELFVLQTFQPL